MPVNRATPWTKRQEIPNVQVLDAASQFETAYRSLREPLLANAGVLLPFLSIAAIAVELYL